jgi:topoisomerase-like DNA binding C4 zinc finger protein
MPAVTITKEEMDAVLTARGFTLIESDRALEYTYQCEMPYQGVNYNVRIYSSIDKRNGLSRPVATDAIRLFVLNEKGYTISKEGRVNRTKGWEIRLNVRIDNWTGTLYLCPQCKHPLRKRVGKFGEFMGCTAYPNCGYTQPIKTRSR